MANTEPQQARTSSQPRLLRIRANLNASSAKCLLRAGLTHNYTHAYIIAILKGKLPARKSNDTNLGGFSVCCFVYRSTVRQSVGGTSRVQVLGTPPKAACGRGKCHHGRGTCTGVCGNIPCLWQVRPRQNCLQGASTCARSRI